MRNITQSGELALEKKAVFLVTAVLGIGHSDRRQPRRIQIAVEGDGQLRCGRPFSAPSPAICWAWTSQLRSPVQRGSTVGFVHNVRERLCKLNRVVPIQI